MGQAGEASACALLAMLEHAVSGMPPATAAAHSDALFAFLQRALDARQLATSPQVRGRRSLANLPFIDATPDLV